METESLRAAAPCVLIVVDGLRPDAIPLAPMPALLELAPLCAVEGTAQSLMPNCTLPCHFSIFHSVPPERHGITSNVWAPMVRPILGLFEVLHAAGKRVGFAYNWEELRDLGRPGSVDDSFCTRCRFDGSSDTASARHAVEFLECGADFVFCYLGETDEIGHRHGWMSPKYLQAAAHADSCLARVLQALPDGGSAVILADHGGHGRSHGTDCPEDMTVPLYVRAPGRESARVEGPSLLDIAPTVATLCGVAAPGAWEGRALVG
jgi:predicted AlkP superfamily pyrophosphatase or phosphodiesterase